MIRTFEDVTYIFTKLYKPLKPEVFQTNTAQITFLLILLFNMKTIDLTVKRFE